MSTPSVRWIVIPLLAVFGAVSCLLAQSKPGGEKEAASVAARFINAYVQAIPRFDGYMGAVAWVKRNPLASASFKKRLETLYKEALRADPEMGYGADAVLGAQDYPDGFRVKSVRIEGDRALVRLEGTTPFPASLRMVLVRAGDSWLVDGSGDLAER